VISIDGVGVFLGLDVGKQTHHGHGLTPDGKKVFDKQLPNSEPKLRAVFDKLAAKFGTVLVVVDQPASIGALPLTVARDAGCQVAYLPGLAMRRIADLYPGEAKTDAKDAVVIADAARTMPHTLRTLDLADEVTAELTMLVGFDQDLAGEANRTSNRIRGLLTQFHPSLERVLGPRLDHPAITWLLERYGSPQALRKAGRRKLVEVVRPRAPRMAERLIDDIFTALDEQTVTVPGTGTLDVIVPSLAKSLAAVHEQRRTLEARIEALLEAHPLSQVLTSMPGIGVRTAAVLLTTVGDGSSFPTAAHLASYAGLAPTTRQSGTSIHGEHAPSSNARCSSPRSRPSTTPPPGPTTTAAEPAAKPTPRPSSASPATASASCSPCSATEPSTNRGPLDSLDEGHRGTPPAGGEAVRMSEGFPGASNLVRGGATPPTPHPTAPGRCSSVENGAAKPVIVAIDGPSGTGKSSTSKAVAAQLGLSYLDTGAQYRAITWWMVTNGIDIADPSAIAAAAAKPEILSGTDPTGPTITVDGVDVSGPIREQDVTSKVSAVSAVPEVRARITELQRAIAASAVTGIVVEGRDIGTTVLPDADLKIFLTASPEARAARRSGELKGADLHTTREALIKRDAADSSRKTSPLAKADDAVEVDTTDLTLQQVIECVVTLVEEKRAGK
jgi:cytidylate kinase